jgi:hypothetical protein
MELNGQEVKRVKFCGVFPWHHWKSLSTALSGSLLISGVRENEP